MTHLKLALRLILPTVIIGIVSLWILFQKYDSSRKSDLLQLLSVFQATLDGDDISELKGSPLDTESPVFQHLHNTLTKLANTDHSIRYIYLMRRVDDKVIFLVDSKSNQNLSQEPLATPGEVYEDVTSSLLHIFDSGKNRIIGPESDRWGTFFSALGPIYTNNGQIAALVGVDVDFAEWYRSKVISVVPYMIVLLLIIIVEIIGVVYYNRQQLHIQTQAYLANIVETSHDAIISLNLDGTVRSWNQGATEIFGYTSSEAMGKKGSDLVYSQKQKDTFKSIYSKTRLGQTIRNLEVDHQTKDGKKVTILISATPIYDSHSIVGISVVAKDITTHSNSRKNLALRNQELEKLNRLMINREIKIAELKSEIKLYQSKK